MRASGPRLGAMEELRYEIAKSQGGCPPQTGAPMPLMVTLIVLTLAILLPFLFASLLAFTRLVEWEYANHRTEWERDGRPTAPFFRSPVSGWWNTLRSGFATNVVSLKWLFVTPSWIRTDARALQLLRRLRICAAVWNFGIIAALGAGWLLIAARVLP